MRIKAIAAALAAILSIALFTVTDTCAASEPRTVELNSGAARDADFIAVNEEFTTADGQTLKLVMTGLKPGNKEALLQCLRENYNSSEALKIVDEAFCDSEKWDSRDLGGGYDASQCWAAAASNMLWVSGWPKYFDSYPEGAVPFSSEDDLFRLFNDRFSDEGSDTDRGIDWVITGEYYVSGGNNAASLTIPAADDGYRKTVVSSLLQSQYDLTENAFFIEELLKAAPAEGTPQGQAVFQGSIGALDLGELCGSLHAISIYGVIIDPQAVNDEERYKAIIIVDSDNDGDPSEDDVAAVAAVTADDEETQDALKREKKAEIKAGRPNSYTFYPLSFNHDINGTPYWEIVGGSDPEDEYWEPMALFSISELLSPTDDLISSATETDGSLDHMNDPDFTLDTLIITGDPEGFTDPSYGRILQEDNAIITEVCCGDPIRLNYFVANRNYQTIDIDAPEEERPSVTWRVTRDSDGSVVAEGTHRTELPIMARIEGGSVKPNLIVLNEKDGNIELWEPGEYTLTAEINADRSVREAYYINNQGEPLHFSITGEIPEVVPPDEEEEAPGPDSPDNVVPGDTTPGDTSPGDTTPDEVRPSEVKPSEVNSNDTKTYSVSSVESGDDNPAGLMMLLALISLCFILALVVSGSDETRQMK